MREKVGEKLCGQGFLRGLVLMIWKTKARNLYTPLGERKGMRAEVTLHVMGLGQTHCHLNFSIIFSTDPYNYLCH